MSRKKGGPDQAQTARKADPSRIVKAAIACIEKRGATHTGVAEVAAAAGVGRQTVYRVFPTRQLLLEAVISDRLRAMALRLSPIVSKYASLEEAIINGSIKSVSMGRQDPIFLAALGEIDHGSIEAYMISPGSPLQDFMLLVWREALAAARRRGELRQDLGDVDIVNWLRGVHLILTIREDLKPREAAQLLKAFVMPGLVAPVRRARNGSDRKADDVRARARRPGSQRAAEQ